MVQMGLLERVYASLRGRSIRPCMLFVSLHPLVRENKQSSKVMCNITSVRAGLIRIGEEAHRETEPIGHSHAWATQEE